MFENATCMLVTTLQTNWIFHWIIHKWLVIFRSIRRFDVYKRVVKEDEEDDYLKANALYAYWR